MTHKDARKISLITPKADNQLSFFVGVVDVVAYNSVDAGVDAEMSRCRRLTISAAASIE